jgi:hypothetical protein
LFYFISKKKKLIKKNKKMQINFYLFSFIFFIFHLSICYSTPTEWMIESKMNGEWKEFGVLKYSIPQSKISSFYNSLNKIQKSIDFQVNSPLHFQINEDPHQIITLRMKKMDSNPENHFLTYLSVVI